MKQTPLLNLYYHVLTDTHRIHSPNLLGSERNLRTGIQENNRTRAYYQCSQGTIPANLVAIPPALTRLQRLGFDSFTTEVEDVLKDHKQQQKASPAHTYIPYLNLYLLHL